MIENPNKIKAEGGMASMTDLVFLLLIFFIIMSTRTTNTHDINLPSGKANDQAKKMNPIDIILDEDNQYHFMSLNADGTTNLALIEKEIKKEMAKAPDKEHPIKVHADKFSETGMFTDLFVMAERNKWQISFVTKGS